MTRNLTPERWREIERLYHGARELTGRSREAFLATASESDEHLRQEVESLLAEDTQADTYLERPALEVAARAMAVQWDSVHAGRRIGGYELISRLGSGGMGEVYRARDLRLERDVALKVLDRSEARDPAWVRRFEEEARAASGLTHPNIVTIYGVGEDGDLAYIAMELVHGRTLRDVLAAGGMSVDAALDLAVQFAEALASAHAGGIIHRDLKPENLMVTADGRLKVLDFGIAKRGTRSDVAAAPTSSGVAGITEHGLILGTIGYMSPEQAGGHPVDHRSDQFSFGVVLYELLTGTRAFDRDTRTATLRAVKEADFTALPPLGEAVPSAIREFVRRCLSRHPEDRYAHTAELAQELRRIRESSRGAPVNRGVTRRRVLWLGGAASLSAAAAAIAWRGATSAPLVRSLIVLPFTNVESDPRIEYLCDGITESLIRRIGYVPDLDVRPRSAVFNFKGTAVEPREAGRRLRSDSVLAGSVAAQGDRIVVIASLIDVASGAVTWSERYDRRAADLPALQHELALAIVEEGIRRGLDRQQRKQFARGLTEDAAALDLFQRGVHEHRQGGEARYLAARAHLSEAVTKDPTFALGHVALASTFSAMAVEGFERPTSAWPEANRSIRRALEIDPDLPEAHAEQASAWFYFDHDWSASEREWTRALAPGWNPALPELLAATAVKLWALGRTDEALAATRRARAQDPLSPRFGTLEGDLLLNGRQIAEAARVYEEVIAQSPADASAYFGLAEARRAEGDDEAAIAALRRGHERSGNVVPAPIAAALARARGADGYRDVERAAVTQEIEALEAGRAQGAYVSPLDLARAYARAGDADGAFRHLDAAFEERSPGLVYLNVDRAWIAVRGDERFRAAVRAVGLPQT